MTGTSPQFSEECLVDGRVRLQPLLPIEWTWDEFEPFLADALAGSGEPRNVLSRCERLFRVLKRRDRVDANPLRCMQFLCRQFLPSPFFTRTLAADPPLLSWLAEHPGLSAFRSREDFAETLRTTYRDRTSLRDLCVRQRRCLARLAACDLFNVLDLKTVTLQLSLLADATVQIAVEIVGLPRESVVLALGKLGGEELNYSSDLDLVVLSETPTGQRTRQVGELTRILEGGDEAELYRVDMRLRPWGGAGPLVSTAADLRRYLQTDAEPWERQAFLKARAIAGDVGYGDQVVGSLSRLLVGSGGDWALRASVAEQRTMISDQSNEDRDLKNGRGSIRDIEFTVQYLQLANGSRFPTILKRNTLDTLTALADVGLLDAEQYRVFSDGYILLRTIEHTLQLQQNRQTHSLPVEADGLRTLSARLDYPSIDEFIRHLESYRSRIDRTSRQILSRQQATRSEPEEEVSTIEYRDVDITGELAALVADYTPNEPQLRIVAVESSFAIVFVVPPDDACICAIGEVLARSNATIYRGRVRRRKAPESLGGWFECAGELDPIQTAEVVRDTLRSVLRAESPHAAVVEQCAKPAPDSSPPPLLPLEIVLSREEGESARIGVRADDRPRFLTEMCQSLHVAELRLESLRIETNEGRIADEFEVTGRTSDGRQRLTDPAREHELRATIVLAKHFAHLLPRSTNPTNALRHFRDFCQKMFQRTDWVRDLASLQQSRTLAALSELLGVSDFLWHDFLRYQHKELFPVLGDVDMLREPRTSQQLRQLLRDEIAAVDAAGEQDDAWVAAINRFKDREMLRADLRHILGFEKTFGRFSRELTDIAEVVLSATFARRIRESGQEDIPSALCVLGKCGGREMGFASDIEVLVLYDSNASPDAVSAINRAVERLRDTLDTRRAGIFELDFRLRPFGVAGPLASSLDGFVGYFGNDGDAWPFERQALTRLRAVAGDAEFCRRVEAARDQIVYGPATFDLTAMLAMRESQIQQHVDSDRVNVKLSRGGLVDIEYFTQALQMRFGSEYPSLRSPNTRQTLRELTRVGLLAESERLTLRDALRFFRQLIDALRMVRGDARDLTVPATDSTAAEFLSRRLRLPNVSVMVTHLHTHQDNVIRITSTLQERLE